MLIYSHFNMLRISGDCGTWRSYIRKPGARRPCAHEKSFLTCVGSFTHNHINIAGQRIVRHLIRRDFLVFQYRTGRFHCLISLKFSRKDSKCFDILKIFESTFLISPPRHTWLRRFPPPLTASSTPILLRQNRCGRHLESLFYKKIKNFQSKVWKFQKMSYLCNPNSKAVVVKW